MSVPGDVMQQFNSPPPTLSGSPIDDVTRLSGDVQGIEQKQSDISAQEASATQQTMGQLQSLQPPQRDHKILDTMPWLIGLVALGGKATGLHAKTMLGATNGMVQGLLQGQKDAFDKASQQYETSRQKLLDTWKMQTEYYNQIYRAYGDQANAKEQAIKVARDLSNDQWNHSYKEQLAQQKESMDETKAWYMQQNLMTKIEQFDAKQQIAQLRLNIEQQNANTRQADATSKASLRQAQIDKLVKTSTGPAATKQIDGMITDIGKQMTALKKKYSDIEAMSPEDKQKYDDLYQQMGEFEVARKKLTPIPVNDPSELDGLDDGQHYLTPDNMERIKGGGAAPAAGDPGGDGGGGQPNPNVRPPQAQKPNVGTIDRSRSGTQQGPGPTPDQVSGMSPPQGIPQFGAGGG